MFLKEEKYFVCVIRVSSNIYLSLCHTFCHIVSMDIADVEFPSRIE